MKTAIEFGFERFECPHRSFRVAPTWRPIGFAAFRERKVAVSAKKTRLSRFQGVNTISTIDNSLSFR